MISLTTPLAIWWKGMIPTRKPIVLDMLQSLEDQKLQEEVQVQLAEQIKTF